jgi:hypothetical protein
VRRSGVSVAFRAGEPTPERTAFVRFRRVVIAHGLDRVLFESVTADLKARAITVKTGTLVDATIIASASEMDEDGRWVKHKNRAAVYGFKAPVGADASTRLAFRQCSSGEGRVAAYRGHCDVGPRRTGDACEVGCLERSDPSRSGSDREDLRHVEAYNLKRSLNILAA